MPRTTQCAKWGFPFLLPIDTQPRTRCPLYDRILGPWSNITASLSGDHYTVTVSEITFWYVAPLNIDVKLWIQS